ncbi:MAG TPA: response regulator transcription factor [Usitatibacter sp.]|nr:response regulator transcription factor [Usitatibacter sp.]
MNSNLSGGTQSGPIRVMLVDDHPTMLWGLERLIEGERPRMEVCATASTCETAMLLAVRTRPDVVLLDLDLGGESSLGIIGDLVALNGTRVVVFTGMRDAAARDQAMVAGAYGVVAKAEAAHSILDAITRASYGDTLEGWAAAFPDTPPARDSEEQLLSTLTPRERRVAAEMVSDARATTAMVAARLQISEHTLRNHLTSIYDKLRISNRLELWAFVNEHGVGQTHDA